MNSMISKGKRAKPGQKEGTTPRIVAFYDPEIGGTDVRGRLHQEILQWSDDKLELCHDYIQWLFPLPEGSLFNFNAPVINEEVLESFRSSSTLQRRLRASFIRMLQFYGFTVSMVPVSNERAGGAGEADECENPNQARSPPEENVEASEVKQTEDSTAMIQIQSYISDINKHSEAAQRAPATRASVPSELTPSSLGSLLPKDYRIIRGRNWKQAHRNWARMMNHNHLRITRILRSLRVLGLQKECDAFYIALKETFDDPKIHIGATSLEFWTRAVEQPLYMAPDGEEVEWLKFWEEKQGTVVTKANTTDEAV